MDKPSLPKKLLTNKYNLLLLILIAFHIITYITFNTLNKAHQTWDSAGHLALSMKFADLIRDFLYGKDVSLLEILTESNYYPPFLYLITAGLNLFFGYHIKLMLSIIFLSFIATLFVLRTLVKELGFSGKTAFLTILFYSLFPLIPDQYRQFHLELPLILAILLCYLFLIRSAYFQNTKYTLLFFATFGVAQLIKWYAFLFFVVPAVYLLVKSYKELDVKKLVRNIIAGSIVFLLLVLPWYLANLKEFLLLSSVFSQGESDDPQKFFSFLNFLHYIRVAITTQMGFIPFIVFILGIIQFVKTNRRFGLLAALQLLVVYLIFTIIKNKNGRYILPLAPGFAFFIAYFLTTKVKNKIVVGLVMLYSVTALLVSSFVPIRYKHPISDIVSIVYAGPFYFDGLYYTYDPYKGPIEQVLEDIKADAFVYGIKDVGVMPLIDSKNFSTASVEMVRAVAELDKFFIPSPYFITKSFDSDYEMLKFMSDKNVSYVLTPVHISEDAVKNAGILNQMIDFVVRSEGIWFEKIGQYPTNEDPITLYRRKYFASNYPIESCHKEQNWQGNLTLTLEPLSSLIVFTGNFKYGNIIGSFEKGTLRILEINNSQLTPQPVELTDLPQSGISFCYRKGTKPKINPEIYRAFMLNSDACGESHCTSVAHTKIDGEDYNITYYQRDAFIGGPFQYLLKRLNVLPWYEQEGRNVEDLFITER